MPSERDGPPSRDGGSSPTAGRRGRPPDSSEAGAPNGDPDGGGAPGDVPGEPDEKPEPSVNGPGVPFPGTTGASGRRGRPDVVTGGAEVGAAAVGYPAEGGAADAAALKPYPPEPYPPEPSPPKPDEPSRPKAEEADAATAAAAELSAVWPGTAARAEMASRLRAAPRPGSRTSPRASCATNHAGR
jgi:hypothetical protein